MQLRSRPSQILILRETQADLGTGWDSDRQLLPTNALSGAIRKGMAMVGRGVGLCWSFA